MLPKHFLLFLFSIFLPTSLAFSAERPNILWLIAEDFGPHLSCEGVKEVWTPNLDALAAKGTRYTRFYTTASVCSSSRSAFMTGMYQTTIGAHNHRSHRDDGFGLPEGVRLLSQRLQDAGYFTANVRELPETFAFQGTAKTDWNFAYEGDAFESTRWEDLKTHQPFFAQINFQETHRAFIAPKKADPAKVEIPPYYPDHPVTRADWAAYLDAASEMDRKVGLILNELSADGLTDNTVIVFFGDNGAAHVRGKQFCYEEGLHVPLIIYWPKDFPAPKGFEVGKVNAQLLEAIDLAPTMLEIAGASPPPSMEGRNFLGEDAAAPKQYIFGARDRCDETVFRFRTVRDERYRYIRNFTPERPFLQANEYKEKAYPVWNLLKELHNEGKLTPEQSILCAPNMPEEELYDLDADPHEMHNLAQDPAHQETRERLSTVLEQWIAQTHDQGAKLEPLDLVKNRGVTKSETSHMKGYALEK